MYVTRFFCQAPLGKYVPGESPGTSTSSSVDPSAYPKKKLSFLAFLRGLLGSLSRTGDDVDGIATHGGLYLLNTETTLARNSLPRACRKAVIQRHCDKMYSSWRASYYANLLCSLGFLGLKKIVLPGIMPAM